MPSTSPPADVKAVPGGPLRKRGPAPALWPTVGQYRPEIRLAGCWVLQPHSARRAQGNKSRRRGRLYSPCSTKARGKEKNISWPLHPRWLASFPPPCRYNKQIKQKTDAQLRGYDDRILERQKEISHSKNPEDKFKGTLVCEHQWARLLFQHPGHMCGTCCWRRPVLWNPHSGW